MPPLSAVHPVARPVSAVLAGGPDPGPGPGRANTRSVIVIIVN